MAIQTNDLCDLLDGAGVRYVIEVPGGRVRVPLPSQVLHLWLEDEGRVLCARVPQAASLAGVEDRAACLRHISALNGRLRFGRVGWHEHDDEVVVEHCVWLGETAPTIDQIRQLVTTTRVLAQRGLRELRQMVGQPDVRVA